MMRFLQTAKSVGVFLLVLIAGHSNGQDVPFAYWNFNNPATMLVPNAGPAGTSIMFEGPSGSEAVSSTGQDFNGQNALNGDPAGAHLRINLPIGSRLYFNVPTTGYSSLRFKYETRRSGSGAGRQLISYSIDGVIFVPFTSVAPKDGVPEIVSLDFTDISAVNNNPNFRVLIEFEAGSGGSAGNNRFDNVTIAAAGGEVHPIADVNLLRPGNNATNVSLTPTLRWSGSGGPYTVQISDAETFQNITFESDGIAGESIAIEEKLDENSLYYWRIGQTIDDELVFSAFNQFTTREETDEIGLTTFRFNASDNIGKIQESISCDIYGDSLVIGLVPAGIDRTKLIPEFNYGAADSVTVDDKIQESQWSDVDFSAPVAYVLHQNGQVAKTYLVKLINTGLPIVYVNTVNNAPIESKDIYVAGKVKIITTGGAVDIDANTSIKGRGNTTWGMAKKPYRLKLNSKASVLGYPADKDWVLLANYSDKTLSRASLGFALGEDFGLEYNCRAQPVELVLNGAYQGSYLLGEHIKVSKERVNVTELSKDDEDDDVISGGYFLEVNAHLDEVNWFYSTHGVPITVKSPEEITGKQFDYIKNYVNEMETTLFSSSFDDPSNGYAKYIDTESFIRWYWVNELFKNNDAIFHSSVFMYKERNEKLKLGPLWDFDISAGNVNFNGNENPSGWWIKMGPWFGRLMQDPAFEEKVYQFWRDHRIDLEQTVENFIDGQASKLAVSQELNFMKWPILNTFVWPNAVAPGSYAGEIDYLKSWLDKRIKWIDAEVDPSLRNFDLLLPATSSVLNVDNNFDSLVFTWNSAAESADYSMNVDLLKGGVAVSSWTSGNIGKDTTRVLNADMILAAMKTLGVEYGDTLSMRWRVSATLGSGSNQVHGDANSAFDLFLINKRLPSPVILSPVIGSQVSGSANTLQWGSSHDVNGYVVQISNSPDFDGEIVSEYTTENYYVVNSPLKSLAWYYWRVMSIAGNDSSAWSVGSFSVSAPPAPDVTLSWQTDGRSDAVIRWNPEGSHSYIIEVSLTEDFSDNLIRVENWDGIEYVLTGLNEGLTYYVRVKAVDADIEGEWSVTRALTTEIVTATEVNMQKDVSIYPNPANGVVTVRVPSGSGIDNIEVKDLRGVSLLSQTLDTIDGTQVDVGNLPAAVYIVVFRSKGRIVTERKLVHQ
ncbi:CotH kinase family protein [Chryseolinea sp. T2]|uniref:CotH kinase family protein n=1 Tax=Chryseolinea sp. T2 TaxID=3129255 RepID=UPI003076F94E